MTTTHPLVAAIRVGCFHSVVKRDHTVTVLVGRTVVVGAMPTFVTGWVFTDKDAAVHWQSLS